MVAVSRGDGAFPGCGGMNAPSRFDVVLSGVHLATLDGEGWGIVRDAAIGVVGDTIAWLGPRVDLPNLPAARRLAFDGAWAIPGLVDCHTHLVYAGNRAGEFERRLAGATYEEIARSGAASCRRCARHARRERANSPTRAGHASWPSPPRAPPPSRSSPATASNATRS